MDGVSSLALLKFFLPQVPGLANTALWHTLGSGETSSKWDLRTTMTVAVLRNIMKGGSDKPQPIGLTQKRTLRDPGIKGPVWIAKTTIPAPATEDGGLEAAVFRAIEEMKITDIDYVKPGLVDIEVEWTGSRPGAKKDEPLPAISEEEKYRKLLAEPSRTSETTILYFHGGCLLSRGPKHPPSSRHEARRRDRRASVFCPLPAGPPSRLPWTTYGCFHDVLESPVSSTRVDARAHPREEHRPRRRQRWRQPCVCPPAIASSASSIKSESHCALPW
nr:hypothetical protein CFP56_10209 [Quercus suber]